MENTENLVDESAAKAADINSEEEFAHSLALDVFAVAFGSAIKGFKAEAKLSRDDEELTPKIASMIRDIIDAAFEDSAIVVVLEIDSSSYIYKFSKK